jgi:hypothetical protein
MAISHGLLSLLLVIGIFEQTPFHNSSYDSQGRLTQKPYTLTTSANPTALPVDTQTASYSFDPLGIRLSQEVNSNLANTVVEKNNFSQVTQDHLLNNHLAQEDWTNNYDEAGEVIARTSSSVKGVSPSISAFWCHSRKVLITLNYYRS